jgi:dTDP-glucose pyrophosphorylase
MTAIIPAAGKGVRMQVVTGGKPKELLPLGRGTVLDQILKEARTVAERVIVVNAPDKPEIESWAAMNGVEHMIQPARDGFADAVALTNVEDDAVILLGDCPYHGGSPLERMANIVYKGIDGAIAVETVPDESVRRYGIVEVNDWGGIDRIREKPKLEETESRWAIAARYAFSIGAMAEIRRITSEFKHERPGTEVGLSEVMQRMIDLGLDIKAVPLSPEQHRADCGSPEEYESSQSLLWE